MTRYHVERADATISYQRIGEGPAVTMIQGLGMPGEVWRNTAERIADEGFCCLVVDNRGTGRSVNARKVFTMADLADDVAAVMEHALGEESSYVMGISLGGMISQHVALRHPERVRGLVLAATTCGLPHNLINGAFFTPQALSLLFKICFSGARPTRDELVRLLAHEANAEQLTDVFLSWDALFQEQPTPPGIYLRQLLAATLHSTGAQLHRVTQPTYVLTGEGDFLISPKNSELLAALLPNARLVVLERAGHIFPHERPEALVDAVRELHRDVS